ncbi:ATP-binding cassette domain-containing protein [Nocardioides carbamazepini]|uniref:ABC transporter ATP-binding protein n=1 Tax=Nocardioides carbamazepini TaxID=2854259 RepID=UPI00214A5C09|nr:oligopeptide/dipeptide ABC transporter ATP-binding protein [Nocardioides carbamazepini]MCR1782372.1 ATP-binding cassette domain-containing protein [Nocardioides carbamazepini]
MTESSLLEVRDLHTHFPVKGPGGRVHAVVQAVDGVSFDIPAGRTLGLVGESGCGKSTLGRTIMNLERATSGSVTLAGQEISQLSGSALRRTRGKVQMIFQDPLSSLDPRMRVERIVGEGLAVQRVPRAERAERVAEALERVGLRRDLARRYPHQFSGGQRQRIGIARALVMNPDLVIADEAVSALDVSVQAQVLNLMRELQQELGLAYLFISHDLAVVEHVSDRVGVMYLGKLVELADAEALYAEPLMPYTEALLSAIPSAGVAAGDRERIVLSGDLPTPLAPPSGCRFRTRCWKAQDVCAMEEPVLREVRPGHWAACHLVDA